MSKKNYTVLTPIEHNNKRFEPGATIGLDDEQADPLLAVTAIAVTDTPAEDENSSKGKGKK